MEYQACAALRESRLPQLPAIVSYINKKSVILRPAQEIHRPWWQQEYLSLGVSMERADIRSNEYMGVIGENQTPLQQGRNPPQAYLGTGLVTCLPAGSVAHSGLR